MKSDHLKKALIRMAVICVVIILLAGAITYFGMNYDETLASDIEKIKSDTTSNQTQYALAVKQLQEAKNALEFYGGYSGSEGANPENFRRDYAKNQLGKIKDQLDLVDLKFSMDQFQKKADNNYDKKQVSFFTSKVTVELSANSDVDIYEFIESLSENFPGSVVISSYTITRKAELSEEEMAKLTNDELATGIVGGQVVFEWGTILDNPVDQKEGGGSKPLGAHHKPGEPNG